MPVLPPDFRAPEQDPDLEVVLMLVVVRPFVRATVSRVPVLGGLEQQLRLAHDGTGPSALSSFPKQCPQSRRRASCPSVALPALEHTQQPSEHPLRGRVTPPAHGQCGHRQESVPRSWRRRCKTLCKNAARRERPACAARGGENVRRGKVNRQSIGVFSYQDHCGRLLRSPRDSFDRSLWRPGAPEASRGGR